MSEALTPAGHTDIATKNPRNETVVLGRPFRPQGLVSTAGFGPSSLNTRADRAQAVQEAIRYAADLPTPHDVLVEQECLEPDGYDASAVNFTANGFSGQLLRSGQPYPGFDVRAYGANPDTAPTAAITAAVDAAAQVNGTLVFPAGVWEDVEINGYNNITIAVEEGAVFRTADASQVPAFRLTACSLVSVVGRLVADGNKANNASGGTTIEPQGATVSVDGCTQVDVPSIRVFDAWRHGVHFSQNDESTFGRCISSAPSEIGVAVFEGNVDCTFDTLVSVGGGANHGIRLGGSAGEPLESCSFGKLASRNAASVGVLIENNTDGIAVGSVVSFGSGSHGLKIENALRVNVGQVVTGDNGSRGAVLAGSEITVDSIVSQADNAGVIVLAPSGGGVRENIYIGSVVARGTSSGNGFEVSAAGGETIQDVGVGMVVTRECAARGTYIPDTGTIQQVHIGSLFSRANTGDNLRIEPGVMELTVEYLEFEGDSTQHPNSSDAQQLAYSGRVLRERFVSRETLDLSSSTTLAGIIPAGAVVDVVVTRVTSGINLGGAGTQWQVGDGSNPDRWGVLTSDTAAGTVRRIENYDGSDNGPFFSQASQDVVLSQDADSFTGGEVEVTVIGTFVREP